MGQGKVRHLVKLGVSAESVQAQERTTPELKAKIRRMVERGIVQLEEIAKQEFLTLMQAQMLVTFNRLLNDLDKPEQKSVEDMTEEELARIK
jgi:hypothetical protein